MARRQWHYSITITVTPGQTGELAYGITGATAGGSLVRFYTSNPGAHTVIGPLSGVVSGQSIRAIDFNPADGRLYALSNNAANGAAQLYTVDLATAALTPIGAGLVLPGAAVTRVSMDFNPRGRYIRVVTSNRGNYRVDPATGSLIAQDTSVFFSPGDPLHSFTPFLAGVAYTNDRPGAGGPTAYAWDYNTDSLVRLGGPDGILSPSSGALFTVNTPPGFLTSTAGIGMDVSQATGIAYVQHDDIANSSIERLQKIDLETGAVTMLGVFSVDMLDISIALLPCAQPCQGDANFDGIVNFADITTTLLNWLSTCP